VEATGLQKRVVRIHQIDARAEIKAAYSGRLALVCEPGPGAASVPHESGSPAVHQGAARHPLEAFQYVGYGLFVGKSRNANIIEPRIVFEREFDERRQIMPHPMVAQLRFTRSEWQRA